MGFGIGSKYLERDLGIPVVISLLGQVWYALRRMHIVEPVNGYGALLRDHADADV